ncbi:MAG: O-antigen ligase family protein [Geminicoccaceae bacterium]|nr:O-antigen ligase family protein [Geminicoccaceae bacterium]
MASVVDLEQGRAYEGRDDRRGLAAGAGWLLHHLLSFELVFVLFLYSNEIKMFLGWIPGDETVALGAVSIGIGGYVILREGLYLRGLFTLAAAMAFIGWALMTVGWTPSVELVKRTTTYLVTFNLWCVVAGGIIIANRRERVVRFLCFVAALALCLALIGVAVYLSYGAFRRLDLWGIRRVYLGWGYTVADGTAVLLCIALFSRFGTPKQIVATALFGVTAFFLLVGGARAPLLGVGFACVLAFVLNPPVVGRNRFDVPVAQALAIAVFVIAACYIGYLFLSGETTNTLERFVKAFNSVEDTSVAEGPSRVFYWPAAYRMWLDAPWVGNGLASFSMLFYGREIEGGHPHNIVLEILAEQGVVGLSFFLVFVWSAARGISFRRLRADPLLLAVIMIATTTAMSALFAKDLAGGKKIFFMIALLALRPPPRLEEEDEDEDEEAEAPSPRRRLRPVRTP